MNFALSKQELEDFLLIKRMLCSAPILGFPDFENLKKYPFQCWTDYSTYALSAILTQEQQMTQGELDKRTVEEVKEGKTTRLRLIAAIGRKNPVSFQNLGSSMGEASALLLACQKLRPYLLAGIFILKSDSLSISFLHHLQDCKGFFFRLYQTLSGFRCSRKEKLGRLLVSY